MGERGGPGDVECDQERQSDGYGVETDGTGCRMDGATSGARRESKRLESCSLAGVNLKVSQHERRNRTTDDIPRPSAPPAKYTRSPSAYVDPPR